MITIENLRYRTLAIDNLEIPAGITSIIGPNGSGKTTLLKLCAGIAEPESGTILIDGIPPRKKEIGWVNEFPDRNILFGTVADEIASPLRFRRISCEEISRRVEACMEIVGIACLKQRPVRDLSGGEKILVALAAALVIDPNVLVLDEYDSHLDASHCMQLEETIRGSQIPYVIRCTQQMETAAKGDCLVYAESGRIRASGTPPEVFRSLSGTPFYPLSWRCRE
jgi:energy-coupling factor transport system ATP-binding protein